MHRTSSRRKRKSQDEEDEEDSEFQSPPRQKKRAPTPAGSLRSRIQKGAQQQTTTSSKCSHSGIVKSLKMYNFMCHAGFYQEWHSNLNFITGENGSGKSALLTGLLIGLGAKATVTSRTKSMTSLIQKGKDSARTEITLMNYGSLPEDKYGPEVTIERTISKTGTSSYKLITLNKSRKIKKNELDWILLSLNIQLDNPVAILNQEVAKNFLRTKDPRDKYQLFYQGTLLSKLFNLLAESKDDIDVSEKNLKFHKNVIAELQDVVSRLEVKLKEYENLKNIKGNLDQLTAEYMWAIVYDEMKNIEKLKTKIEKYEKQIKTLQENIEALRTARAALEDAEDEGERVALQQKIKDKEIELEQNRRKLTIIQNSGNEAKAKIKTNKPLIARKKREITDAKETLEQLNTTSVEDEAKAIKEYEEKKELFGEEKKNAVVAFESLNRDVQQFRNGMEKAREEIGGLQDGVIKLERLLDSRSRQLSSLQKSGSNTYAIFGPSMENLMSKINSNRNKFKQLPRGPVGSLLTVKDAKYVGLVEYILRSNDFLATFIVDNGEDMNLLRRFIGECYNRNSRVSHGSNKLPSIKLNGFKDQMHDLSRGMARVEGVRTLLEMIDVEKNDPVIINALVDYVEAEKKLVFSDNTSAANVMKHSSRCQNVKMAYTLDFYKFNPAPMYAAISLPVSNHTASVIKSSKKAQIAGIKREVDELNDQIAALKPELESKQQSESALRKQLEQIQSQLEGKRRLILEIDRKIRKNEEDKYTPPDIASHVEEIKDMESDLQKYIEEIESSNTLIEDMNKQIDELKKEREEMEFQIKKFNKSFAKFDEGKNKILEDIRKNENLTRNMNNKIKDKMAEKKPTEDELEEAQKQLERKKAQAENFDVVQTERSSKDVKAEFEDLRVRIQTMEKQIGDANLLQEQYANKSGELERKLKVYKPTHKSFVMLQELVQAQLAYLFIKRTEISNGLSLTYQALAEQRGYKGQMMIDHEKQELHFFICPDKSSATRADGAMQGGENDKNTKRALIEYSLGLSGGERSFSTICFIMSLWQVMECPFYMLDEFDVFMDAFNRKASQQALIAHAKNYSKNQFFLFSPLDLVELPSNDEATVIRLRPARPERDENAVPTPSGRVVTSKSDVKRRKGAMAEKN